MSNVETMDRETHNADAISEPEHTVPSQDTLKAKAEQIQSYLLAGRRDGAEFCEAVLLDEEGGYAYRRVSPDNSSPWRFMRTKDFQEAYETFKVLDMKHIETTFANLVRQGQKWKGRFRAAYKSMGGKSRKRLAADIAENLGTD